MSICICSYYVFVGSNKKKTFRYKPGTVALREIRHFQKTTKLLIPAASFIRQVSNELCYSYILLTCFLVFNDSAITDIEFRATIMGWFL